MADLYKEFNKKRNDGKRLEPSKENICGDYLLSY